MVTYHALKIHRITPKTKRKTKINSFDFQIGNLYLTISYWTRIVLTNLGLEYWVSAKR